MSFGALKKDIMDKIVNVLTADALDLYVSNHQWLLLLTWFNFNPSMDKSSHPW